MFIWTLNDAIFVGFLGLIVVLLLGGLIIQKLQDFVLWLMPTKKDDKL